MKLFLYDETMQNEKAKLTTSKMAAVSDIVAPSPKYLSAAGASAPASLVLTSGILISVGNSLFKAAGTTLTAANLDTGSGFTAGKDYYVYACDPTSGDDTVDTDEVYKISLNATYPSGYTADNSRKIGGFHYGIVRKTDSVGTPIGTDSASFGTGWISNIYTGIVPASVWTVGHRPKCDDPSGMVYMGGGKWVDIYLCSDNGNSGVQSKSGATPITGTEGLNWYIANERLKAVGKRLPSYADFCQYAYGSPEGLDSGNTQAWSATGNTGRQVTGYVDNAVSAIGCRDAVGNVWEWLDELCLDPTASAWGWQDVLGSGYGDAYIPSSTALRALVAGGSWGGGVHDGSRAVYAGSCPWYVAPDIGCRGVSDSL